MKHDDLERFTKLITGLVEVQGWKPWGAEALEVIFERMNRWSFEDVEAAYMNYAERPRKGENSQFRPGLGEIISRLPAWEAVISDESRAELAWSQVMLDLPSGRITGRHKIDDIAKKILASMGGIEKLSRTPDGSHGSKDELTWKGKEFMRMYVTAHDVTEARKNQLAFDSESSQIGSDLRPKAIGADHGK